MLGSKIFDIHDEHRFFSGMNNRSDSEYYCSTYSTDENEPNWKIFLAVHDADVEKKTFHSVSISSCEAVPTIKRDGEKER